MTNENNEAAVTLIHCWSAPRSRSTALLYSFEARSDCRVLDEPLYRAWLLRKQNLGVTRPYLDYMLTGQGPTQGQGAGANWAREQLSWEERLAQAAAVPGTKYIFCKHMAKHAVVYDFDSEEASYNHVHLLLLRDPVAVLSAWGAAAANHGNVATPMNTVGMFRGWLDSQGEIRIAVFG